MSKFKIGDRVRFIPCKGTDDWQDVTITHTESSPYCNYIGVDPKNGTGSFHENQLEYIVISPIQTETRRVLKPGVYGVLEVGAVGATGVRVPVSFQESGLRFYDADELESAAMVLSQLAEFLREQDA